MKQKALVGWDLGREGRCDARSRVGRSILAVAAALVAVTAASAASAYCRTTICPQCDNGPDGCPSGLPIIWPTSCVTFTMQYGASKQIDLVRATEVMDNAFAVWQQADCGDGTPPAIHIDHRFGTAACTLHEYNQTDSNANIIMFRDEVWPYEGSANVLGLTTVTYSRKTGNIFDVDMEINATQHLSVEDPIPPTAYDLQSILTHEAGHFLGMAHSNVNTATMWWQYTSGSDSFRELDPDDVEGICAVYAPSTPMQCDPNPRQGFSAECGVFPSGEGGICTIARVGVSHERSDGYGWLGVVGAVAAAGVARRGRRRSQAEGR